MIEEIENFIITNKMIESGDKVVIGVSGGPDSICLLDILRRICNKDINFEIYVAHINHMIRENANLDEEYVKIYCEKYKIPFFVKRVDVLETAKLNKMGIEETGREIRYSFFEEVRNKVGANKIATAHNANDNAETIILNIIRGCGINGLIGIEAKTGILIRPLIQTNRADIEKYCLDNNLNPRRDESNDELIYQRNKVRNVMIPYIEKEFNQNFIGTLNRISNIAKESTEYINNIAQNEYDKIVIEENKDKIELKLGEFNALEDVIKKQIIRYTINKILGNLQGISNVHIEDILKMCSKKIGNKFLSPNKRIKICIYNKKIIFVKN